MLPVNVSHAPAPSNFRLRPSAARVRSLRRLKRAFGWDIRAAYQVSKPFVFSFLEGSTAIAPGQSDSLDIRAGRRPGLCCVSSPAASPR